MNINPVVEAVGIVATVTLCGIGLCTLLYFAWRGHQQWLAERQELKAAAERAAHEQQERNPQITQISQIKAR